MSSADIRDITPATVPAATTPLGTGVDGEVSAPARGGARSLLFRIITAGSDFLTVVVTARAFGVDGRGLYALTSFAITALATLLSGPSVVMRAEVGRKREPTARLFAAALLLCVAVAAVSLAGSVVVLTLWPNAEIALYVGIALPFMMLTELQISLYQSLGEIRRMHWIWVARSVVPLAALAAVGLLEPGDIQLALLAWACVQSLVPVVSLRAQWRRTGLALDGMRPLFARLLVRGMPISLADGIYRLSYRVDLVVVAALLTVADVGRFSVATAAGESLLVLSRAVLTGAYAPMISSDVDESVRVAVRAVRHCLALLVPAGIALVLVARLTFEPLLGEDFASVWVLVALLVPAFIANALMEILVNFLLVRIESWREYLVVSIAAGAGTIAVSVVLVLAIGVEGAAIATSVFSTLAVVYLFGAFARVGAPRSAFAYLPGRAEARDYVRLVSGLAAGAAARLRKSGGDAA